MPSRGAPAFDGGDAIGGGDGAPSCHTRPSRSPKVQDEAIGADAPVLDHLGLRFKVFVEGEEGVVDHVAVVAADIGGGPDGIEVLEVGMGHDPQHRLGAGGRGKGSGGGDGGRQAQASSHGGTPVTMAGALDTISAPTSISPRRRARQGPHGRAGQEKKRRASDSAPEGNGAAASSIHDSTSRCTTAACRSRSSMW